jgi:hypothetical protein
LGIQAKFGNRGDYLTLSGRRCRKSGFDGVDADCRELTGYLKLLLEFKRYTRCLFAIPKGGIENSNLFVAAAFNKEDNRPLPYWCESYYK